MNVNRYYANCDWLRTGKPIGHSISAWFEVVMASDYDAALQRIAELEAQLVEFREKAAWLAYVYLTDNGLCLGNAYDHKDRLANEIRALPLPPRANALVKIRDAAIACYEGKPGATEQLHIAVREYKEAK
jgi:hypothetical protein